MQGWNEDGAACLGGAWVIRCSVESVGQGLVHPSVECQGGRTQKGLDSRCTYPWRLKWAALPNQGGFQGQGSSAHAVKAALALAE